MSGPFSGDDAVAVVRPGGLIYLGQDQDNRGGGFHPRQSWSGEISQFNIWDFALGTELTNLSPTVIKSNISLPYATFNRLV